MMHNKCSKSPIALRKYLFKFLCIKTNTFSLHDVKNNVLVENNESNCTNDTFVQTISRFILQNLYDLQKFI